jgi:methionine synthase II (cobalamin-independent)
MAPDALPSGVMFATLLGSLPRPPAGAGDAGNPHDAAVRAQAEAGLEPLTDGGAAWRPGDDDLVARWRSTAASTGLAVKAVLVGPYTLARLRQPGRSRGRARERAALELAEALSDSVRRLAAAGCPLIEIEESLASEIGPDDTERRAFRTAHLLLAGVAAAGSHLSLSIVGESAWEAGAGTILDPPYASLAVDLVAGPDNWRLVAEAPRERGIVAGVIGARAGMPEGQDVLLYAAHYAAATQGRGHDRVGLGTAGSLASLPWEAAVEKLRRLGEAARLAAEPAEAQAAAMDPRAVSPRAAALGRTRRSGPRPGA